ncbi:MAG: hypothetical protein DRR16_33120 [Candidatus Parabeggiatoa sp. nov. 3]|nr:MAG: hypothetical protein DRR00_31930 [Gammaproteobacteria bacterium]RKZ51651.1 MAG: hypothetical protein DRQ99_33035 [Gammaproteobacteria bacterium]RKZ73395.1 MAG: hypothetical protein DRR16_33120 [Gammaproteobacteria bacterium]
MIWIAMFTSLLIFAWADFAYRRRHRIPKREEYKLEEIYQQYYEKSEVLLSDFEFAYFILENIFHVPKGYIRPTDHFHSELGEPPPYLPDLDTPEIEDFSLEVDNMLEQCQIENREVRDVKCVDDYVKLVSICLKRGYSQEKSTIIFG